MSPKQYLQEQYPAATASSYYREWQDFSSYIDQLHLSVHQVDYPLILAYVKSLQSRGLKAVSINRKLAVVETVFEGLAGKSNNPTRSFRVKSEAKPAVLEPIKLELLEQLLEDYPTNNLYQYRNQVVLSLVHH